MGINDGFMEWGGNRLGERNKELAMEGADGARRGLRLVTRSMCTPPTGRASRHEPFQEHEVDSLT